jgi:hypothetical protein
LDKKYFTIIITSSDPKAEIYLSAPWYIPEFGNIKSFVDKGIGMLKTSVEAGQYFYHIGLKTEPIPLHLNSDIMIIEGTLNVWDTEEIQDEHTGGF